jgi:hypothetical protein
MNQIRDLMFPPLLTCWLLTFLLQGKKTVLNPHKEKAELSPCRQCETRDKETNYTA